MSTNKGNSAFNRANLKPVIPKIGIRFSRRDEFQEILCKPKLIPLKSLNLMKLEEMERELLMQNNQVNEELQNKHIN